MTHFVGPYTFTDPTVTRARRRARRLAASRSATRSTTRSGSTSTRTATSSKRPVSPASPISRRSMRSDASGYTIKLAAYGRARTSGCCSTRERAVRGQRPRPPEDVPRRRLDRDARDAAGARRQGLRRRHQRAQLGADRGVGGVQGELYRWNMANWTSDRRHQPAVLPERDQRPRRHGADSCRSSRSRQRRHDRLRVTPGDERDVRRQLERPATRRAGDPDDGLSPVDTMVSAKPSICGSMASSNYADLHLARLVISVRSSTSRSKTSSQRYASRSHVSAIAVMWCRVWSAAKR